MGLTIVRAGALRILLVNFKEHMSKYIIYHQVKKGLDCPDGIHAAAIMAIKYSDAHLIGDVYRDEKEYGDTPYGLPCFQSGDTVIIVDFSYPAAWLKFWEDCGVNLKILDHHASKFGMLSGFTGAILDENECGATLAWREVFPDRPLPGILHHVRNRDIGSNGYYDGTNPDSEMIAEGLSVLRHLSGEAKIFFLQSIVQAGDEYAIHRCWEAGRKAVEQKYAIANAAIERFEWRELDGHRVPYLELTAQEDRYHSAIGTLLAQKVPDLFSWVRMSDGSSSLRSKGFDVSVIAAKFGGGGHRKAAGFKRYETIA